MEKMVYINFQTVFF